MSLTIITGCLLACSMLGQTQEVPEQVPARALEISAGRPPVTETPQNQDGPEKAPARTLPIIEIPVTDGVPLRIRLGSAHLGWNDIYGIELRGEHNNVIKYSEIDNIRRDIARGGLWKSSIDKEFKLPLDETFVIRVNYLGKVKNEKPPSRKLAYELKAAGETEGDGYYAIINDPHRILGIDSNLKTEYGGILGGRAYEGPHVTATIRMIELRKAGNEGWTGGYNTLSRSLGFFAEACKKAYAGRVGDVVEYDVPLYSVYNISGVVSVVTREHRQDLYEAAKEHEPVCYVKSPSINLNESSFKVVKVSYKVIEAKTLQVTRDKGVSGLDAVLLEGPPGTPLVIAFAGTVGGLLGPDWLTNYAQGIGFTPNQYNDAMLYVQDVMRRYGIEYQARLHQDRILITGHSLGGALASFVSASTGFQAVCFNAAPIVGMANRIRGAGVSNPEYRIRQVRVADDPVSGLLPGHLIGEHWFVKSRSSSAKYHVSHHDLSNIDVSILKGYEPASRHRLPE